MTAYPAPDAETPVKVIAGFEVVVDIGDECRGVAVTTQQIRQGAIPPRQRLPRAVGQSPLTSHQLCTDRDRRQRFGIDVRETDTPLRKAVNVRRLDR